MHKIILLFLFVITVSGCVSTSGNQTKSASRDIELSPVDQEQVYKKTSNYPALIDFYKSQLQKREESETRLKLTEAYLNYQDAESALFTLTPLMNRDQTTDQAFYLQGVALFRLGKIEAAEHSLAMAREKNPTDAKVINLLGIIRAQQGDFIQSRDLFTQARVLMFDDMTIKNNLALIDMLEENYTSAAARLLPIYLNGEADEQVKANLAIIMAKMGSLNHLLAFYAGQYNEEDIILLYQSLRSLNLATNFQFSAKNDSPVLLENKSNVALNEPIDAVHSQQWGDKE
ncbi:tetratricopeptide repeat protein [Vibrio cincinnatiensis]|uniref:tetratricopeptide repeat protein n=1 Tax=Vibrio cincinnatiensis TaxID=675 RepID=UPI001EDD53C6|nr:hypothetical protein [Vibrio cincinnatiensis]MCG3729732.1 hypothetical protein [Vibrio cincinnatiensis]